VEILTRSGFPTGKGQGQARPSKFPAGAGNGDTPPSEASSRRTAGYSNYQEKGIHSRPGRRTLALNRVILSQRLRLRIPRLTAEKQEQRFGVPVLSLRLAAHQHADRLLIASFPALLAARHKRAGRRCVAIGGFQPPEGQGKAREKARLIPAPVTSEWEQPRSLLRQQKAEILTPPGVGARGRAYSLKTCPAHFAPAGCLIAPLFKSGVPGWRLPAQSPWLPISQVIESLKTIIFRSTYVLSQPWGGHPLQKYLKVGEECLIR
jgi:hypothetical protein